MAAREFPESWTHLNERHSQVEAANIDSTLHTMQLVQVDDNVKLEVIDWGGIGSPVVFLAGLGDTAHVFDHFAPKLISNHHVYGITRRGFGLSSVPTPIAENYGADRLGDDVVMVIKALNLNRPVLVGHSLAGEELSSIGSRFPDKIAGLIYMDAGFAYAYYNIALGDLQIDGNDLRKKVDSLTGVGPLARKPLVRSLLQESLPKLQKDLENEQKALQKFPDIPPREAFRLMPVMKAIFEGEQRYTSIPCPILAFFAVPHHFAGLEKDDPVAVAAVIARDRVDSALQANSFEAGVPSARIVRLTNADHYVFRSNEREVLSEITDFLAKLTQNAHLAVP